VNRLIRC